VNQMCTDAGRTQTTILTLSSFIWSASSGTSKVSKQSYGVCWFLQSKYFFWCPSNSVNVKTTEI